MKSFLTELTRRRVWLFGGIYLALGWVLLQVAIAVETTLSLPGWVDQITLVLLGLGFPVALLLAWAQESRPPDNNEPGSTPLQGDEKSQAERPGLSIAVLPFNNLSDTSALGWICDGLSEDITTRLGANDYLTVAARNSAFAWKGTSPDVREVGEQLGVRFVLEGSLRQIGDTLRITAQLINALDGAHVWTESYDHLIGDFDTMQDKVVDVISGEVFGIALSTEGRRLETMKAEDLEPDDLIILLLHMGALGGWTGGHERDVFEIIESGLKRFPDHAGILAIAAQILATQNYFDPEGAAGRDDRIMSLLARALQLAPLSYKVLTRASATCLATGRYRDALHYAESFVELHPRYQTGYAALAMAKRSLGNPSEALLAIDTWFELAGTHHPDRYFSMQTKAAILLDLGETTRAEELLREINRFRPTVFSFRVLIACLVSQGKIEEAQVQARKHKADYPDETLSRAGAVYQLVFEDQDRAAVMTGLLQEAGLE